MNQLLELKNQLRRKAYDARNAQPDKDAVSQVAIEALVGLPEYHSAQTVLWYLDCRSELRTRHVLPEALASDKRIIVPYCTVDELGATSWDCGGCEHGRVGYRQVENPGAATRSLGRARQGA